MIRLYVNDDLTNGVTIEPDVKQSHYLTNVMRLKSGDVIGIFNGRNGEWTAEIQMPSKKRTILVVQNQTVPQMTRPACILCPAVIKKENMDLILQKATELGVTAIFPMITERTVVRGFNLERAESIIREACEQCERNDVPTICEPKRLDDLLQFIDKEVKIVHLVERDTSNNNLKPTDVPAFLIGPEGGFTVAENSKISRCENVCKLHLGTTILRAETAAIGVLAAWQFRLF